MFALLSHLGKIIRKNSNTMACYMLLETVRFVNFLRNHIELQLDMLNWSYLLFPINKKTLSFGNCGAAQQPALLLSKCDCSNHETHCMMSKLSSSSTIELSVCRRQSYRLQTCCWYGRYCCYNCNYLAEPQHTDTHTPIHSRTHINEHTN